MAVEQIAANANLEQWLAARQTALKIVKTTTTPSGQTLDWVPIGSQDPIGKIMTAPPAAAALPVDAQRPVSPVSFELQDMSVERGPAGTVPVMRPRITALSKTLTVKDYLSKPGGVSVNKKRPSGKAADPNPFGYFHAIDSQNGTFYGTSAWLNVWDPTINTPAAPGDDHSIMQTWLQNYVGVQQSIEGGWTVDQVLNGDLKPHLFIFYTTNGYSQEGNNLGGYNTQSSGYVQYSSTIFPGALLTPASTYGGGQFGFTLKFQLYKEPTNGELNWWIGFQGGGAFEWMGYYPASLFAGVHGGLGTVAQWVGWGGEVDSTLANPALTQDQMGSGHQAACGWTKAAFIKNIMNQSDMNGDMVNNNGVAEIDTATGAGANYTIQMDMNSGSSWGSYVYLGGPTSCAISTAKFSTISFNIVTGGDDLRGDSSATASVVINGSAQTFTLKAQSDPGWGNNSDNVKTFNIAGAPQLLSAFGAVTITLTSHDSFFETQDNWNIQSVNITLSGANGSTTMLSQSGNPLARLTGSGPSVTLHP